MDLLEAAIILEMRHLIAQGGVTDWHIEEAQKRLRSIRENNVGESILYASRDTPRSFQIYAECIAVMAFTTGGITFAGRHFEARGAVMTGCEPVVGQ